MERQPVKSSNIAEVGYDPATRTLEVAFRTGAVYQYLEVPETVYRELLSSESVGNFLNVEIKKNYQARKVNRDEDEREDSAMINRNKNTELNADRGWSEDAVNEGHKVLRRIFEELKNNRSWSRNADDVVQIIKEILEKLPEWQHTMGHPEEVVIRKGVVTDDVVEIGISMPGSPVKVAGSPVSNGINIVIRRGPDGKGYSIEIETYIERLICTNGITHRESRRYRVMDGKIVEFAERLKKDMPAIQAEICRNLVRYFGTQHRTIDNVEGFIEEIRRQFNVDTKYFDRIYCAFMEEPGNTLFHVINAVSRVANMVADEAEVPENARVVAELDPRTRRMVDPDPARNANAYMDLQRLAGELLDHDIISCPACGAIHLPRRGRKAGHETMPGTHSTEE